MPASGRTLLLVGAALNLGLAALHLIIIFVGAPAYLYFGAASLAQMAEAGSAEPALITFGLAGIFVAFALYALSGAGIVGRVPFLTSGLVSIGILFTLRGLIVVVDVARLITGAGYPIRQTVFSSAALVIGLVYLLGTLQHRESLRAKQSPVSGR